CGCHHDIRQCVNLTDGRADQENEHSQILERIYSLVGGRVLSARDATSKFQYAGRDSETEVWPRRIDLEGKISVEIVSRGVGTHRCRRTQYRASDIDWSVIRDEIHRGGVEYDAS
ncbi:hypothetical protein J6590_104742, partial [Homalodisca vitripennis]